MVAGTVRVAGQTVPAVDPAGRRVGLAAKPAGVYVIDGSNVSWRPAVDVNRIVLGGQIVAVVALLVLRSILRTRR